MSDLAHIAKTQLRARTEVSPTCLCVGRATIESSHRERPRAFHMDVALDKAARVFRERGYHATSIPDLTKAMGQASRSVYTAFKDKRTLFLAVFDQDVAKYTNEFQSVIRSAKPGRDRLRDVLILAAENSQGVEDGCGCLLVNSAAHLAAFDADLARHITEALDSREMLLADLIRQGQADGSIAVTLDVKTTALFMLCLIHGMRVIGRKGQSRAETMGVVDVAMKVLG